MSVADRFAKLLVYSIDPQSFNQITVEAHLAVKTLNDCLLESAKRCIPAEKFDMLMQEAQCREDDALLARSSQPEQYGPPAPPPSKIHTQIRLAERFNLEVSLDDVKQMEQMIIDRAAGVKQLKQNMEIRVHYEIVWQGKRINVVYSPRSQKIITALPMLESKTRKNGSYEKRRETRGNPRSINFDNVEDLL